MRVPMQEETGSEVNYNDVLASMRPKETNQHGYQRTLLLFAKCNEPSNPTVGTREDGMVERGDTLEDHAAHEKRFKDPKLDSDYQLLPTNSKKEVYGRSYLAVHRTSGQMVAIARVKNVFQEQLQLTGDEERILSKIREVNSNFGSLREKFEYTGAVVYVMDLNNRSIASPVVEETDALPNPTIFCDQTGGAALETLKSLLSGFSKNSE